MRRMGRPWTRTWRPSASGSRLPRDPARLEGWDPSAGCLLNVVNDSGDELHSLGLLRLGERRGRGDEACGGPAEKVAKSDGEVWLRGQAQRAALDMGSGCGHECLHQEEKECDGRGEGGRGRPAGAAAEGPAAGRRSLEWG